MHWLGLFSQFDVTIHHIPGEFNIATDALSHHSDLDAVVGSVESVLLTWIQGA